MGDRLGCDLSASLRASRASLNLSFGQDSFYICLQEEQRSGPHTQVHLIEGRKKGGREGGRGGRGGKQGGRVKGQREGGRKATEMQCTWH